MIGIEYEPPGGVLGRLATADVIGRELKRLFAYRRERLMEWLTARLGSNAAGGAVFSRAARRRKMKTRGSD